MAEYVVKGAEPNETVLHTQTPNGYEEWRWLPVREEIVRCWDCKHGHITVNGKSCKWCDLMATHDPGGSEPNNGYDPEPYFDADFFCAWGVRREDA